jgi:hypothetical protein
MTTLETQLGQAQTQSLEWLVSKGPTVAANIPQYFITYSNSMSVAASRIKNATTKAVAIETLNWLQRHIESIPTANDKQEAVMTQFGTDFKSYKKDIDTALDDAAKLLKTDQDKVDAIKEQLRQLYEDIAVQSAKANGGIISIGTSGGSFGLATVGFGFSIAMAGNPLFPILGMIAALSALTYGAIKVAIADSHIEADYDEVKKDIVKLGPEVQAVAILNGLRPVLKQVDTAIDGITTAMHVSSIWQDEADKISDVITNLANYNDQDFKSMTEISTFPEAVTAWEAVAQIGRNIQLAVTGIKVFDNIKLK